MRSRLEHHLDELRTECDQLDDLVETGAQDDETSPGLRSRLERTEGTRDALATALELWDEPERWLAHRDAARREERAARTHQNREYWTALRAAWDNLIRQRAAE